MSINRDIGCLEHIVYHCQRLEDVRKKYGDSVEQLSLNLDYKEIVTVNIEYVGANIAYLSNNFKQLNSEITWNEFEDFGIFVRTNYRIVTPGSLYFAISKKIPRLKDYCEKQLDILKAQLSTEIRDASHQEVTDK